MGKHSKKRTREDSSHRENKRREKHDTSHRNENAPSSSFSFENYKLDINRALGGPEGYAVINDLNDFWIFIRKYESIKKKAPIEPEKLESDKRNNLNLPIVYDKKNCISLKLSQETKARAEDVCSGLQEVILLYSEFRQRERLKKLLSLRDSQHKLPVAARREDISRALLADSRSRVLLVAGDTGCGKSTQVPVYLWKAGLGRILVTQPRRVACVALSRRVAMETLSLYRGNSLVGYQVRFDRRASLTTAITFATEGVILRRLAAADGLTDCDVLVLDEIHERHLLADFLLGLAKCLLQTNSKMRLALMSATINLKLFADYFSMENVEVIQVPGRLYPIDIEYRPSAAPKGRWAGDGGTDKFNPQPYIQIMQLIDTRWKGERGDLLIFLPGAKEIETVVEAAREYAAESGDSTSQDISYDNVKQKSTWVIVPLHASLSVSEQERAFAQAPEGARKCVVATNVAETSLTVDGVRFVADSGRERRLSHENGVERLRECWVSRASAEQRKGRAGRIGPGVCFRLYSQKQYEELEPYTPAEIVRLPLEGTLLQLAALGLSDVRRFPFIEPPPSGAIESAIIMLKKHGALTEDERITPMGRALANLPVDLPLAKVLISGCALGLSSLALITAAVLGVQSPYTSRAHRDLSCQNLLKSLKSEHGDAATLLAIYRAWLENKTNKSKESNHRNWCKSRGIEEQRLYELTKLRQQFSRLLEDWGILQNMKDEMSAAERTIRHGQVRQLREARRQIAKAGHKRPALRIDANDSDGEHNSGLPDIHDIEFRLRNDESMLQDLLTDTSSYDQTLLKLILCSGLYPQVAIPDEYNYCKSASEQLFHTQAKAYVALHPTSVLAENLEALKLREMDIEVPPLGYFSKKPLSSRHRILCYLSLLETTKPYLLNTIVIQAAQTLLLFAHCIETNSTFSQLVCDSWLLLDFPVPETGQILLMKAVKLRHRWQTLMEQMLQKSNCMNETSGKSKAKFITQYNLSDTEKELQYDLSAFMRTEISYTIHRLLPADLKNIYIGTGENLETFNADPFQINFECIPYKKGGMQITPNVMYNCLIETEWSYNLANEISQAPWTCSTCSQEMCLPSIQKLIHRQTCGKSSTGSSNVTQEIQTKGNNSMYECDICKKTLNLTPVEILRHKKQHSNEAKT